VRGDSGEDAGGKAGSGGAVLLVAARPENLVHRPQGEAAARQGIVDCRDAERQDAVARRLLDPPDAVAKHGEIGRTRHALWSIAPCHMRKAHLLTCNYRKFAGSRMSRPDMSKRPSLSCSAASRF
jgi:hypothetical protein